VMPLCPVAELASATTGAPERLSHRRFHTHHSDGTCPVDTTSVSWGPRSDASKARCRLPTVARGSQQPRMTTEVLWNFSPIIDEGHVRLLRGAREVFNFH
jgi:hypothetical protein